jgi:hypothetical protein
LAVRIDKILSITSRESEDVYIIAGKNSLRIFGTRGRNPKPEVMKPLIRGLFYGAEVYFF